jgi:hypothetical protein
VWISTQAQTLAMSEEETPRRPRPTKHESRRGKRALPPKHPSEVVDLMEALRRAAENATGAARDQPVKGNRPAASAARRRPAATGMPNPPTCPFCGSVPTDGLCVHLIADFGDGTYGDRGIMCGDGGSRCGNSALDCMEGLEAAVQDFATAVGLEEGLGMEDKDKVLLRRALYQQGSEPLWFGPLADGLADGEESFRTVEKIWGAVVPWSAQLQTTWALIGTMASTMVTFVWAQDPYVGSNAIADAVGKVTIEIRAARETVVELGWRVASDEMEGTVADGQTGVGGDG